MGGNWSLWQGHLIDQYKTLMLGGIGGRRRRGWLRIRWLDGITDSMDVFEWTPGVGDGQGGLACCDSWGRRVGHDWAAELNWTEVNICYAAAAAKLLQSCPTLCDPWDGSPPGSPVLGFSRQEHWSGLPFPSPMHESEKWKWRCSVVSTSSRLHEL